MLLTQLKTRIKWLALLYYAPCNEIPFHLIKKKEKKEESSVEKHGPRRPGS